MTILKRAAAVLVATCSLTVSSAYAETLRIAQGFGILFAPIHIMKEAELLEKHAQEAGVDLTAEWLTFPSGGAVTDALLSNNVDIVAAGVSNMLILWDRSNERVKAISAISGTNSVLVTKDPDVKSLADFTETHRISVPTIKMSNQAVYLAMALEEEFGDHEKFDSMMVQLGHADGMQAMLTPNGPIQAQFAGPPFYQELLAREDMHAVTSTMEIAGPATNLLAFTTTNFHDKNSNLVDIFLNALKEANAMIHEDPLNAAKLYLASSGDSFKAEDIAEQFFDEGNVFQIMPYGVQKTAAFMGRVGLIQRQPESWREFFFENLDGMDGIDDAN